MKAILWMCSYLSILGIYTYIAVKKSAWSGFNMKNKVKNMKVEADDLDLEDV